MKQAPGGFQNDLSTLHSAWHKVCCLSQVSFLFIPLKVSTETMQAIGCINSWRKRWEHREKLCQGSWWRHRSHGDWKCLRLSFKKRICLIHLGVKKKKSSFAESLFSEKSRAESWTLPTCGGFGCVHWEKGGTSAHSSCVPGSPSHTQGWAGPKLVDSCQGTGLRRWYVEHKPLFDRSTHSDCTPQFVDYIPALCHQQPIYPLSKIRFLGWELCPRLCLLHGDRHTLVLLELNFHDQ